MHTGLRQAEFAAVDFSERHSADNEIREQLVASLLVAPVAAGLPVSAIHRAMRTVLVRPGAGLRTARVVASKCPGPVIPR